MVVAHRGASFDVAEHTLDAYVAAIASGADALECDVRLTRDGHLVCVHDRTLDRTSNGSGVVSTYDLARLREFDFSSWHAARRPNGAAANGVRGAESGYLEGVVPNRLETGGGILTLRRLLELVHDAPRPVRLLVETKHPTRYQGLVEKSLVEVLAHFGWAGRLGPPVSVRQRAATDARVIVMSFAATAVRRIKLLAPDVPTVLLLDKARRLQHQGILPAGVSAAGPGLHVLRRDPSLVRRVHERGRSVFVWTVDEPEDVEFVRNLDVDTVITNRPAQVLAQLGADSSPPGASQSGGR